MQKYSAGNVFNREILIKTLAFMASICADKRILSYDLILLPCFGICLYLFCSCH